jgi:hypothetical protein
MKNEKLSILSILIILILNSCKKETIVKEVVSPNITIYGFYEGKLSSDNTVKYLNFDQTNNLFIYRNDGGIKSMISTSFVSYEKQAILDFYGYSTNVYNYITKGDSLTIFQGKNLIFNGKKTLSSLVDNWNFVINSLEKWKTNIKPSNPSGLAWDGSNILLTNYSESKIFLLNPSTKNISDFPSLNSLNTIEFDGSNYWFCRNGFDQIFKTTTADATTPTFTSINLYSWIYGIAYASPTQIYCYASNDRSLFLYNPVSNSLVFEKKFENGGITELAYSNGFLYATFGSLILKINPAGFIIEKTYILNDAENSLVGIAYIGGNSFWVSDEKNTLYKVEL